jgi:predicted amidohydrolase
MAQGMIKIASCQFPVSENIRTNTDWICRLTRQAAEAGAEVVHFSECALCGYAGTDFSGFEDFDWVLLREKTREIMALAAKLGIWVVLPSSHQLTEPNKPHNCLYLITPQEKIADRYDKRFCTEGDLQHYTPGDRFVIFDLNGVRCALLICFDLRFPEIYRALYKEKVQCIFQSFYNARQMSPSIHAHIMRQTMQTHAACNHFWISMTNSSSWLSPYPSCFIQPDGEIISQMEDHKDGFILNTVDISKAFYDPSAPFRKMAIDGKLTNGTGQVDDLRSLNRNQL